MTYEINSQCTKIFQTLKFLSHWKKDTEVPEHVQRRITEVGKGLEHKSDAKQLRQLWGLSLGKSKLTVTLFSSTTPWEEIGVRQGSVSSAKQQMIGKNQEASVCSRGNLQWVLRKYFYRKAFKPRSTLPREMVELLSLEIFKRCVGVVLRDMV